MNTEVMLQYLLLVFFPTGQSDFRLWFGFEDRFWKIFDSSEK